MVMDEQQNQVHATSSTNKRASATNSLKLPTPKKRVVLGDLTNSPNVGSTLNSDFGPNKPKWAFNSKEVEEEDEPPESEIVLSSMEPFNCAYSNSIYNHLRAQEVHLSFFIFIRFMLFVFRIIWLLNQGLEFLCSHAFGF